MRPVAIVPVAGVGTRLKPYTLTTPKPLLLVAGKPILGHILDQLIVARPERVVLVVGPGSQGDRIRSFASRYRDLKVECVTQGEPRGLGHAVAQAKDAAGGAPLLIVLGDTIVLAAFEEIVSGGSKIGVREVSDPRRFGVATVRDGRIVALEEKPEHPASPWAVVGLYFIEDGPALFSSLDELTEGNRLTRGEIQLTDALQSVIRRGADLRPFPVEGWYDCGTLETLLGTNRALLDRLGKPVVRERVVVVAPVAIDPAADVAEAVIGPHVTIGPGARVRRAILRDCIVNEGATVEDILLEGSVVGEDAVVRGAHGRLDVVDPSDGAHS